MPVKIVGPESETQIVDLLSIAFADDPVCRYLYPNLLQYLNFFPEYVRLYGAPGLEHGGAHLLEGIATALWVPPGTHSDETALDDLLARSVQSDARAELIEVYDAFDQAHPKEPHWFLPLMGVDPVLRGKGIGVKLMEFGLDICDRDGTLAYLESTNPRNDPFYERFGFARHGLIDVAGHPPVTTMTRRPR